MAGKHRVEAPTTNMVAKAAGLAGIAVTASLLSAGAAHADPISDALDKLGIRAGNASSNAATAANKVTTPLFSGINTGSFFTAPDKTKTVFNFGNFITKPGTTGTGGISGITKGFPTVVTGFCLNSLGCN